jgi:hypothetical protein
MKITHLNERLTLIANISVVAGIVFLGLELNQNTGVMKAQAQADLTANRISYAVRMMDPVNADLVVKAGGEGVLNASEQLRYEGLLRTLFLSWESEYYQFQNGLLQDVPATAWRGTYKALPQMAEYWSTYKNSLTPEFAAFLDQVVTEEE